ncbi:MAG: type II toxin-antitoxin system RelE/ParE family toxin [Bilifractor sp.]
MKYEVIRTDTADALIRKIILYVAENFGNDVAIKKLDELEEAIMNLADHPYIGIAPKYTVLKRQGYLVLILEKNLVFYKVNDEKKQVIIYAVVDQRQDYLSIIRGL